MSQKSLNFKKDLIKSNKEYIIKIRNILWDQTKVKKFNLTYIFAIPDTAYKIIIDIGSTLYSSNTVHLLILGAICCKGFFIVKDKPKAEWSRYELEQSFKEEFFDDVSSVELPAEVAKTSMQIIVAKLQFLVENIPAALFLINLEAYMPLMLLSVGFGLAYAQITRAHPSPENIITPNITENLEFYTSICTTESSDNATMLILFCTTTFFFNKNLYGVRKFSDFISVNKIVKDVEKKSYTIIKKIISGKKYGLEKILAVIDLRKEEHVYSAYYIKRHWK
jgi:hypothetical protein